MKLIIKITILSIITIGVLSLNLKSSTSVSSSTEVKEDFTKQWQTLLITTVRPPALCMPPDHLKNGNNKKAAEEDVFLDGSAPKAKSNSWAKQQGFGASAYLFDHWDEVFKTDVLAEFTKMWDAAIKMAPADPKVYPDPYNLDKIVHIASQGQFGSLNATVPGNVDTLISQMAKFSKTFNGAVWKNSVSPPQMYNIIAQWGWKAPLSANPTKKMVDMYDFDGDGRLNPSEFLLLSIIQNKPIFKQASCKLNCFTPIFESKIDPLFAFLDCDQDGLISSENMWAGLVNLKKADATKYSMYQCQMPTDLNKGYRTTSCNDFVLKNTEKADGFVNLNEFRAGILLGYWDRHTDNLKIIPDDTKNMKALRWGDAGVKDTQCEKILALMPKSDAPAPPTGAAGSSAPVDPNAGLPPKF